MEEFAQFGEDKTDYLDDEEQEEEASDVYVLIVLHQQQSESVKLHIVPLGLSSSITIIKP